MCLKTFFIVCLRLPPNAIERNFTRFEGTVCVYCSCSASSRSEVPGYTVRKHYQRWRPYLLRSNPSNDTEETPSRACSSGSTNIRLRHPRIGIYSAATPGPGTSKYNLPSSVHAVEILEIPGSEITCRHCRLCYLDEIEKHRFYSNYQSFVGRPTRSFKNRLIYTFLLYTHHTHTRVREVCSQSFWPFPDTLRNRCCLGYSNVAPNPFYHISSYTVCICIRLAVWAFQKSYSADPQRTRERNKKKSYFRKRRKITKDPILSKKEKNKEKKTLYKRGRINDSYNTKDETLVSVHPVLLPRSFRRCRNEIWFFQTSIKKCRKAHDGMAEQWKLDNNNNCTDYRIEKLFRWKFSRSDWK